MLDISLKDLEKVLYCESYIVIDPKETGLTKGELLTEERYMQLIEEYGEDKFVAGMGGEAVLEMVQQVGLPNPSGKVRQKNRHAPEQPEPKDDRKPLEGFE